MKIIYNILRIHRHISIQAKILGIVIMLILFLASLINWEVREKTSSLLEKQLIQHGNTVSTNVAHMITEPILTNNIYQLNSIMEKLAKEDPNIRYYFILDKDNNLILSSFSTGVPKGLLEINHYEGNKSNLKELKTEEGIIWDIAAPIAKGFGGTLRIGISENYRTIGLQEVSHKIIQSTSIIIILTIFFAYLLTKLLTYPIKQLVTFATKIGSGNYDSKLEVNWWFDKEIATLLETFNKMARNLKEITGQMENAQKTRKKLLQKIISAQEEERARVSRELHDEANQCLAAINLGLDRIHEETDLNRSKYLSHELKEIVLMASSDLKRLAWELRPSTIDKIGLNMAIKNYIDNFAAHYKININYQSDLSENDNFDGEVSIVIYRIIQETLTNIAKHSKSDHVEITIKKNPKRLMIIIEDNGQGFDKEKVFNIGNKVTGSISSLGLYGMMERAELVGGNLIIESEIGQGTAVYLTIPLS